MHDKEDQQKPTPNAPGSMERFGNFVLNAIRAIVFVFLIGIGIGIVRFYYN